ncbi:hypothetical protein IEQ44_12520 [Nocardioides sp. Y6]|uniref:DUF222 domain-containing protein n=1 Tax=Nocardioides malaquae TaxID=2773426 RepID=A0ABR9RV92_9ACTN|nr:hypothetical protein [Nocardioides malaquae]MBE7325476.1 hypothetical protein [Nocardioides malaquae]
MRFTEHELTQALHGAAKTVLAGRKDVRKQKLDVDDVWRTMDKFERYQLLDGLGGQLLPVLVALPDVEVEAGTRATFTSQQVTEAVESVVGDSGGKLRRKAQVALTAALVTAALQHLPVRRDPDGLTSLDADADADDMDDIVVPDSLEGLEGFS